MAALGLATALALGLGMVLTRALTRPLARLAAEARAVGTATRPAVSVAGPPEVRALANELNAMAEELHERFSESERAKTRLAFLAGASQVLASSLDYQTTLNTAAQLAIPDIADWCVVSLWGDGTITDYAVAHSDAANTERFRSLREKYPFDPGSPRGPGPVIRTGTSELYPDVTTEILAGFGRGREYAEQLAPLGFVSAMVVPLRGTQEITGAISLFSAESGRRFGPEDLAFAEDLGRRAGLAVENARLYDRAQRISAELRVANEAKDEFLGMISHEMRTPITVIYGGARMLVSRGDRIDTAQRDELIHDIERESERLFRIVEDLLVLARVELGGELPKKAVDLVDLARRVAERSRRGLQDVSIERIGDVPAALGEPTYIEQVVRNLVENAHKYGPPGGEIVLRIQREEDDRVRLSVLDRGPGVDPAEVDLIFDRFYRSSRTATAARGAGMGLAVCRRLVEAQGGRIWASAREGGGLEVSFTLPVATPEPLGLVAAAAPS
jgi:signal transduction histidine kinase